MILPCVKRALARNKRLRKKYRLTEQEEKVWKLSGRAGIHRETQSEKNLTISVSREKNNYGGKDVERVKMFQGIKLVSL